MHPIDYREQVIASPAVLKESQTAVSLLVGIIIVWHIVECINIGLTAGCLCTYPPTMQTLVVSTTAYREAKYPDNGLALD